MNDIKKIIETVDENNLALRNAIVAFDNVCNSQKEANRLLGLILDIFEVHIDQGFDFHQDELSDYIAAAKFLRKFGRSGDRVSRAEDLIEGI